MRRKSLRRSSKETLGHSEFWISSFSSLRRAGHLEIYFLSRVAVIRKPRRAVLSLSFMFVCISALYFALVKWSAAPIREDSGEIRERLGDGGEILAAPCGFFSRRMR